MLTRFFPSAGAAASFQTVHPPKGGCINPDWTALVWAVANDTAVGNGRLAVKRAEEEAPR